MLTDISAARIMGRTVLLIVLLALPGPVLAQAGSSASSQGRVGATGAILLKGGQIAGQGRAHLGGWAGLIFGNRLAVGGGGFALLDRVELPASEGGSGFELDLGYGGLFFRYWEPLAGSLVGGAGVLLGAGHAEVRDQVTLNEVGSDNFMVAEAEMSVQYPVFRQTFVGLSAGYRLTAGVEDLPKVSAGDLNTFSGTIFLRIGGN